jgi:hypothetical protein
MPDIFLAPFTDGPSTTPWMIFVRLLVALLLGMIVAWIYLRTTRNRELGSSFPITLVLLSVLIAMVTQVIGDSVARAFSLVGALSIVRFRTVVRDTRDTAYVIFAVVVGMAIGAHNLWVATIGIAVIGIAAFIMAARTKVPKESAPTFLLTIRLGLGHDLDKLTGAALDAHLGGRKLISVATAKQGSSLEFIYETRLRPGASPEEMIKVLNRIEGVQDVQMQRRSFEEN